MPQQKNYHQHKAKQTFSCKINSETSKCSITHSTGGPPAFWAAEGPMTYDAMKGKFFHHASPPPPLPQIKPLISLLRLQIGPLRPKIDPPRPEISHHRNDLITFLGP